MLQGHPLSPRDLQLRNKVCVLNHVSSQHNDRLVTRTQVSSCFMFATLDERPPPAPAPPPPPAPAPAPLHLPMNVPPKRPDNPKPKLPPRPLSKVFSSTIHGAAVLQVYMAHGYTFISGYIHANNNIYHSNLLQHFSCFPLKGFDSFRGDETLCDVVLVPGDSKERFPVHRVIMASSSDYFKAMFTG